MSFLLCSWQDKAPLTKTPVERAWVLHEMGWCAFELGKFLDARDYGESSLQAAEEAENTHWQLHASVLLAQSQGTLHRIDLSKYYPSFLSEHQNF